MTLWSGLAAAGECVVASGIDVGGNSDGGGIFALTGGAPHLLSRQNTAGLDVTDGLLRALSYSDREDSGAVMRVYDSVGLRAAHRLDGVVEPHDVRRHADCSVVVSTSDNEIVWFDDAGEVARRWRAPGTGDSWHLNSLLVHKGALVACAFGRFERDREWTEHGSAGTGVVFDVDTGADVLTGLDRPHNPHALDEGWLVCGSAEGVLLRLDASGTVVQRVHVGGWTRGLALIGDAVLVGTSIHRLSSGPNDTAAVVVLDRSTLQERERIPLPTTDVYDVVVAPLALAAAVQRDSGMSPMSPRGDASAAGDVVVPESERRVAVVPAPVSLARAGDVMRIACEVSNLGVAVLGTGLPSPVQLSYQWYDAAGDRVDDGEPLRTPLPYPLAAAQRVPVKVRVRTPDQPGRYLLRLLAVQEHVAWFEERAPTGGVPVDVVSGEPPARTPPG